MDESLTHDKENGWRMTTKQADKIRLLVTIVAIIGAAVAIGLIPSLWATR